MKIKFFLFLLFPTIAWAFAEPVIQFPEIQPTSFYPKRIQSKSRQASEFFLDVSSAPVSSVTRRDPTRIEPPIESVVKSVPDSVVSNEIIEEKESVVDLTTSEQVAQEFQRTYISQNKYLSLMEVPGDLVADEQENVVDSEPYPDSNLMTDSEEDPIIETAEITAEVSDSNKETETTPEDDFNLDFIDEPVGQGEDSSDIEREAPKDLATKVDAFEQESQTADSATTGLSNEIKVLQMKINFDSHSTALTGKNVSLISSFAQIALNNPTNSVEISISNQSVSDPAKKKRAAERLALVSRVLKDSGLTADRIRPVLSPREEGSFALRLTNKDSYGGTVVQTDDLSDFIRARTVSVEEW